MKTLPAGMQAHLDSGATTLCWCWRIARDDSLTQGFIQDSLARPNRIIPGDFRLITH